MRIVILTMFLVSIFTSCTKDKIGLMDKRNDCKSCSLLLINEEGNIIISHPREDFTDFSALYSSYCELLKDLNGKSHKHLFFDSTGMPGLTGDLTYGIRCK